MSDGLAEIEFNWDPEARHDAGFLTMDQITWLIAEVKRLRVELDEIKARGYGGLFADELRAAGHQVWLHDFSDSEGCWCHRGLVYSASAGVSTDETP